MRPLLRFAPCLLVGMLALIGATPVGAEVSAEETLSQARAEEARSAYEAARKLYERLLANDGQALTADQRAKALQGAARCSKAEGLLERAVGYWEQIIGDGTLPAAAHEYAQRELDDYRRKHPKPPAPSAEDVARRRAALMAERRKQARRLVEAAKRARDRGEFEPALAKVFEALALDPNYEPAHEERTRILAERPDRATMLEAVLRMFQTQELTERRTLSRTVRSLRDKGKAAGDAGDLDTADQLLRDAILRIDESGFLETGGPRYTETLLEMREEIVVWLQQVHERAAEAGKTFRPIPEAPDFAERTAGLQGQLFALLAQLFRPHDARESLRFLRFGTGRRSTRMPLLSSRFENAHRVGQSRSKLTRARWAERRVRESIGSNWTNPWDPDTSRRTAREPRILARFGDLLAVQHREDVLRRVEALRAAFPDKPPELDVDIRVFATGSGGTVRVAEALELRATGKRRGLTLIHREQLAEQCADALAKLPGVTPLGSLQVGLHETSATELTVTQMTSEHPMFKGMPPPPLVVPADLASYGLWMNLYAEDLSEAESGLPRCAVSLVARTLMPTHTTVVPRSAGQDMPYSRVPRVGEHRRDIDVELPHRGTLVVLGLPNPFVPSNAQLPELVVLLSAWRADDDTPDPPNKKDERIVPDPYQQREHDLGALATEVFDHAIDGAWPELASADNLPQSERVLERNEYLASMLTQFARLDPEYAEALSVVDGRCVATLTPAQHTRVARGALVLHAHETDLYRIETTWAVMSNADWTQWVASPGVAEGESGAFRVVPEIRTPLDDIQDGGRLFVGRASTLARATQRVGVRRLQERSIVRDIRIVPHGTTGVRLLPEVASVHQGVVIEARPGFERDGLRSVILRVRAAQWDKIESRPHPGTESAQIDVPVWKRSNGAPLSDQTVTEIVGDDDLIVVGVPMPGDPTRRLAVKVRVRRVP